VVVAEHAHDRDFHVGGAHPLMEPVVANDGEGFFGRDLDSAVALKIDHGKAAVGSYGAKLFGDDQVQIFVMLTQGGEAVGVVADVKSGAQWVVSVGNGFAEVGHAAVASFSGGEQLALFIFQRAIVVGAGIGNQCCRKLHAGGHVEKEIDKQD